MDLNDSTAHKVNIQSRLTPLAELLRPGSIDEVYGQDQIIGDGKPLRLAIDNQVAHSMVFWGPAGSGKTTLARIVATSLNAKMHALSAVRSGIKEIREVAAAGQSAKQQGKSTVLFVDEVHRFNKAQQDAFLPYIENGELVFIGATTENPSFEINSALLSRLKVYVLKPLTKAALHKVLERSLNLMKNVFAQDLQIDQEAKELFVDAAKGDARKVLNYVEIAAGILEPVNRSTVTLELAQEIATETLASFDKRGDKFYELISALHKSVRGSDPDASLYWMARMLKGGCDPLYIARRLVRIASEDVGNAAPNALRITLDAWDVYHRLGSPEGELAIAQAVVYLACSPKSNAVYKAYQQSAADAEKYGQLEVPLHLRNAVTRLSHQLGYGKNYRYAHDEPDAIAAGVKYFPPELDNTIYYDPAARGVEKRIKTYLDWVRRQNRAS